MPSEAQIKQDFVHDFGERYQQFGLSKLMGRIVGLLIYESGPLSLDQITEQLQHSKGPVSQITRRLSENGLIRKVWVPGSRRDHYTAEDEIFLRAFANHADLLGHNQDLADKYRDQFAADDAEPTPDHFQWRIEEMHRFYELMGEHLQRFMQEWRSERRRMAAAWDGPPAVDRPKAGNDGS